MEYYWSIYNCAFDTLYARVSGTNCGKRTRVMGILRQYRSLRHCPAGDILRFNHVWGYSSLYEDRELYYDYDTYYDVRFSALAVCTEHGIFNVVYSSKRMELNYRYSCWQSYWLQRMAPH